MTGSNDENSSLNWRYGKLCKNTSISVLCTNNYFSLYSEDLLHYYNYVAGK